MTTHDRQPGTLSRRDMVLTGTGMLAAPLAFGAAARAAQPGQPPQSPPPPPATGADRRTNSRSLTDPRKKQPAPPFQKQPQDPPGLALKMTPQPDHGEQSYRGSGKLAGRKALITGGDSGIGRAAAIAFAREGADVAFGYLPVEQPDADQVIQIIESAGQKAVPLPGDIRDEAFCKKLVSDAVAQLGGLDILVNNAGQQVFRESFMDVTTQQMLSTFQTNVFAMVWITQAAIPHLKPGASIICTCSIQAFDPWNNILDYAMTKACNVNFVKGLSKELAPKGIRVNGVAPGPIWTPLQPSGGMSQEKLVNFGKDTPFGRPGQPAELAPTYVLLAGDDASFVTGEIHGVTGGNPTP